MYIYGCAYTNKNIARFIQRNKGKDPIVRPNCQFLEVINEKYGYMEKQVDRLIMVEAIMDLTISDELFINYPFLKRTPVRKKNGRTRSP